MGKKALKYQFEITIHSASNIPVSVDDILISCSRGPKAVTTKEVVVQDGRQARFEGKAGLIKLGSTLYRDPSSNGFEPKEYTLKVKKVRRASAALHPCRRAHRWKGEPTQVRQTGPKTFAQAQIDLSKYITDKIDGGSQRIKLDVPIEKSKVAVQCDVTIKCIWLKNFHPDQARELSLPRPLRLRPLRAVSGLSADALVSGQHRTRACFRFDLRRRDSRLPLLAGKRRDE